MKGEMKTGNQIIEGAIWKQLLFFFFPILLGTFFQQFYNTIDMVIVGRFVGKEALASVGGSAAQIVSLVVGFFTGLSAGAGVIISQHYGAGNTDRVNRCIHTAYAIAIAGSVLFMILGIVFSPRILRWMSTPEELLESSAIYLRIYFAGILFVFIYNIGSGILRALGDSRRPLYYLIVCCLVNVILDVVMVLFLGLGVAGVAIATLLAQAVSAVLVSLALMRSKGDICLEFRKIRFDVPLLKSQLYLGIPGGVQSVTYSLSNIIIQTAINGYGTNATASWAALGKVDAIVWMISGAFGVAITTFTGQNYGAGKRDRIKKGVRICLLMDQAVCIFLTVVLALFGHRLLGIFTADKEVLELGSWMLLQIAPWYVIFSFIEIYSSSLRGMGIVIVPMIMNLFGVCALRVSWTLFIVPLRPSLAMVIMNYPVTWITTSILFILYYRHKKKELLSER